MAGKPITSMAQDSILVDNSIVRVSFIDSTFFGFSEKKYLIAADDVYCKSRRVFLDTTYRNLVYSIEIRNDSAFCEGFWLNGNLRSRDILITKDEDLCPYYITIQELYCENGNLVWRIDSADIDKYREFYSYYCDGSLHKTYWCNPLMGQVLGNMITYYRSGKIKSLKQYDAYRIKSCYFYYWNENGKLEYVAEFDCRYAELLREYKIGFFNRRKWNRQYREDFGIY